MKFKKKKKRLEVLGNTFNLHSNSTYAQEVRSLNQFICMCSRIRQWLALTYTPFHSLIKILNVSLLKTYQHIN